MNYSDFEELEKATVTLRQLNQSFHTHPFSAISEFVDNCYDSRATRMDIDIMIGIPKNSAKKGNQLMALQITDNGSGMSREEALKMISFGKSTKEVRSNIGRYGNGLKTGAFYVGASVLVITKKNGIYTVLLISKEFQEASNLDRYVVVPCPSFDENWEPVIQSDKERRRLSMEKQIIEEWGILGQTMDIKALKSLSSGIKGDSGTIVIIGSLKKHSTGVHFLNFFKPGDIVFEEGDIQRPLDVSLKARLSRLYLNPKMEMYIKGNRVVPAKICATWIGREAYSFQPGKSQEVKDNMKILKKEHRKLKKEVEELSEKISELEPKDKERQELEEEKNHKRNRYFVSARQLDIFEEKAREKCTLNCGIEVRNREDNGIHVYINDRLIRWGFKGIPFFKEEKSKGISAYIALSSVTNPPNSTKEKFSDENDFKDLMKKCGKLLMRYSEELESLWIPRHLRVDWEIDLERLVQSGWAVFWKIYARGKEEWSPEAQGIVERHCGFWRNCGECQKWIRSIHPVPEDTTCKTMGMECEEEKKVDEKFNEIRKQELDELSERSQTASPIYVDLEKIEKMEKMKEVEEIENMEKMEGKEEIADIEDIGGNHIESELVSEGPFQGTPLAEESNEIQEQDDKDLSERSRPATPRYVLFEESSEEIEENEGNDEEVESEEDFPMFEPPSPNFVVPDDFAEVDVPGYCTPQRPQSVLSLGWSTPRESSVLMEEAGCSASSSKPARPPVPIDVYFRQVKSTFRSIPLASTAKRGRKRLQGPQKSPRERWLEEKVNQFLLKLGQPTIGRNYAGKIDEKAVDEMIVKKQEEEKEKWEYTEKQIHKCLDQKEILENREFLKAFLALLVSQWSPLAVKIIIDVYFQPDNSEPAIDRIQKLGKLAEKKMKFK
uniref:CW-type domain-containing protein n=1 Tax=Caenorhabditis tropicalis TaxID=1561998 RepID=A0A1I7TTL9_9PELO